MVRKQFKKAIIVATSSITAVAAVSPAIAGTISAADAVTTTDGIVSESQGTTYEEAKEAYYDMKETVAGYDDAVEAWKETVTYDEEKLDTLNTEKEGLVNTSETAHKDFVDFLAAGQKAAEEEVAKAKADVEAAQKAFDACDDESIDEASKVLNESKNLDFRN